MVVLAELLAIVLYATPLGLFLASRSRRDRPLWQLALDLPVFVALHLLAVMLVARAVRLDVAILLTDAAAIVGGSVWLARRWREGKVAWPDALQPRALRAVGITVIAAVALSVIISRSCHNADRAWHIPLTSLIRSQTIPFQNVYEPGKRLAYHYAGDVFGATFQVLSLDVIHSSRALSLAHDIAFALTGGTLSLLLLWIGYRSVVPVTGLTLATLLTGPLAVLRDDKTRIESGYLFLNFFKLSYRPHVCLAGLFMAGFVGALLVRVRSQRATAAPPPMTTMVPLVIITGALAMTDEASVGLLGIALGVAWLVAKDLVHPTRAGGVVVFACLAAALVAVVFIGGTLDPGGARHTIALVPARWAGSYSPPVPFSDPRAYRLFFYDSAPLFGALAVGVLVMLRQPTREAGAMLVFYGALVVVALFLVLRIEVDKLPDENHRFGTAPSFIFPMIIASWLAPTQGRGAWPSLVSLAPVVGLATLLASSVSTLDWLTSYAWGRCITPGRYSSKYDFFTEDCREQSAGFGETARPTYLATEDWYYHTGCHPVFSAGPAASHWTTKVGLARFGVPAYREIDHDMLSHDDSIALVCPRKATPGREPPCDFATQRDRCHPLGPETLACELSSKDRDELRVRLPRAPGDSKPAPATPKGEGFEPPDPASPTPH